MKQKVRHRVIGHEHIRQPVIVVIADGDTQAVADIPGDAGLGADIGEDALAVVAIQHAGESGVVERMAIHANAALRIAAERVLARRRIEVVGDEEIEIAVAIDVKECAARAPPVEADPRRARDVGERAIPGVAIQRVWSVVGDVEIGAAVAIDVAGAGAHPVFAMDDAGRGGHIGEVPFSVVVKESVFRSGLSPPSRSIRRRPRTDRSSRRCHNRETPRPTPWSQRGTSQGWRR